MESDSMTPRKIPTKEEEGPEDPVARQAEFERNFEASYKENEEALKRLAKL